MADDEFRELVGRFRGELETWALPEYERDEIQQETLLRYQQWLIDDRHDPIENHLGWLLRTASHVKRERQRRAVRLRCVQLKPDLDVPDRRTQSKQDDANGKQLSIDLNCADTWRRLSPQHRRVLMLVRGYDYAVTEAARELGVVRSTAKSWLSRDTKKLSLDPVLRRLAGIDRHIPAKEDQH